MVLVNKYRRIQERTTISLIPIVISSAIACILFIIHWNYGYDDPYITYRYSQNLAHGLGFVYNSGEHVLSTTTPLYAILLACFHLIGLDIPLLSNTISCISLATGGYLLWKLGEYWRLPYFSLVGLICYPVFGLLLGTFGSEMPFYLMLILAAVVATVNKHYHRMAILLALATLTRADAVMATAAIGIYLLFTVRPLPWSAILTYILTLTPWYLFAWIYFGSPFPATLAAKQLQGQMEISRGFAEGLWSQLRSNARNLRFILHVPLFFIGIIALLTRYHRAVIIILWVALYNLGYTILGVSSYFWYYAPTVVGAFALIGLGLNYLAEMLAKYFNPRFTQITVNVILIAMIALQYSSLPSMYNKLESRQKIYQDIGVWIQQNTSSTASIATLEVGIIGYYAERRMIDFAGLIQPSVAQHLSPTSTYQDTALWATQTYQPNYLVLQRTIFPALEQHPWVQNRCAIIQTFEEQNYEYPIDLYQCT